MTVEPLELWDWRALAARISVAVATWPDDAEREEMIRYGEEHPGECFAAKPDPDEPGWFEVYFVAAPLTILRLHHSEFLTARGTMEDLN